MPRNSGAGPASCRPDFWTLWPRAWVATEDVSSFSVGETSQDGSALATSVRNVLSTPASVRTAKAIITTPIAIWSRPVFLRRTRRPATRTR